jgi:hypothetical protein
MMVDLSARLDAIARAKTINGVNYALNKNSRWERVKTGVAHGAVHLGENMAAWKVGKVVGGAIGQVAASHGADPEVARLLSETAVQALTSTALYARGGKRSGTDIATHMIAQSAAAFSGKVSHTGVDDLSEALGGSERVQAISALVAGKMAGIGTVVAAHKSGIARSLAEGLPAAKTRIGSLIGSDAILERSGQRRATNARSDGNSRKPLNLAEVDNAAELVMMGYVIAALDKYRGDSMSLALDLLRVDLARMDARGQGVACGKGWISPRAKCGKDKASQTPKENLAKTTEKRKKLHALKAEVAGKPSAPRKGGSLALREKDEQQEEAPKKKTSPIDDINEKYASANPSDADVAGWQKDMAVASTIPDPQKAERKIANDLMGGRLGASTKGREAIAEAIYQDREEARKGRKYKASDFSFWGFQSDLDKAKAKVASSRATPEGKQKAQKLVDKLESTKASELKSAQETADRLNQRDSGTKAERLAKINQELDEWVSEDVAKQKTIHEKVKSGDKRAIADAAHEVARKLNTYRAPRDSRKASLAQADQDAIRDHLMDVHQKSGGDANVLGLKKGFTMRELRKAYRESASTSHPDKGGTEEKFRGVSEAYERLKSQARLDSLTSRLDAIAQSLTHTDAFPSYKSRVRTPAGTLGITHRPGDKRFGHPMMASYGHLLGSYGKAEDRKAWDFYLGDEPDNEDLYEVLQTTEAGMPDERKFITHCRDMDHAREVFVSHAGQNRFGYIQSKDWDFFE